MLLGLALCLGLAPMVMAQDTGALGNQMPPYYRPAVVKKGEIRTSEFFYTGAITGNGSAALATDKPSHPLRVMGIKLTCIAKDYAQCSFPAVRKNGTPLTDSTYVLGGRTLVIPLAASVALDTSDSIDLASNCAVSGLISPGDDSVASRCSVQMYTLRDFTDFVGSE